MENASKALIIAGAILLAIVIISLGLIVVNNSKDTISKSGLDSQKIESFNAKFTGYEGTRVSGSQVNSLIQAVIASNQAEKNAGTEHYITITDPAGNTYDHTKTSFFNASTGKNYKVTLGYGNGLVNSVTIAE